MSETIKVLCYKSKTLSNGEHPLMLCVCKDRKRKFQSLGISIKAELWDFKTNQPKTKCPNRERIAVLINDKINEIQKAALDKKIAGKDFTATTLIESTTNNTTNKTVGEYYLTYIQNLQKENRIRYAGMFEVSYSSFIKFNKHLDIPFSDIDVAWLKRYEKWMREQNLSVSTISTRVRHLRAVFNLAITEHSIKSDCYPFHSYKVSKLNRQTAKRALDLFIFSCYTALSYIDVCELRQEDIRTGFDGNLWIIRKRHKTNVTSTVRLLDIPKAILEKYRDKLPNGKILPVISNQKMNDYLKEIAAICGIEKTLTYHVARHSCATSVLLANGVPIETVSKILGHTNIRTTQIYARITDLKVSGDMEMLAQKLDVPNRTASR